MEKASLNWPIITLIHPSFLLDQAVTPTFPYLQSISLYDQLNFLHLFLQAPVPIQHRMSSNPMLTPRPGGPGGGGPGNGLGGRPQLLPQRSSSAQQPPPHPAGGFGPQVPPPAYTSGPRSLHRPKASQGGAKMMGGGPGRGAGAMIPRPLLGPHLTGSGGSVSAQSGSETDVSTSTENLTQVGPF